MDFAFTSDQQLLKNSARAFLDDQIRRFAEIVKLAGVQPE